MPTVILLDVSLSMMRPVAMADCNEEYQRRHLAVHGVNTLMDYLATHSKLEFASLVIFSSLWEHRVSFTRDYDQIKEALTRVSDFDKTCIESGLAGANSVIMEEWGIGVPCQVILITDGSTGIGPGSLKHSLDTATQRTGEDKFPLPFQFESKLLVMCVAPPSDPYLQTSLPLYKKLIDLNNGCGEIFTPEGSLTLKSTQTMFQQVAQKYLAPYHGVLRCGNLQSFVHMYPSPDIYDRDHEFEHVRKEVAKSLDICGFLDIADVSSPPYITRHLVLPCLENPDTGGATVKPENSDTKDEESEEGGKAPSFTVLLHGSLKVEGMVAIVKLADDWYGMMYSYADNKKKSNLMLSIFQPGASEIPWLGNLNLLAPISDFNESPYGDDENKSPFPIKPLERRSYAQNCVVWIKPAGLQADIQKILRHARKLPEKQQHFYKELNRLRRAALSYGFLELLDAMSAMLERECTLLPGTAHPDAALQLSHAANALRNQTSREIAHNILPLRTNFSSDD